MISNLYPFIHPVECWCNGGERERGLIVKVKSRLVWNVICNTLVLCRNDTHTERDRERKRETVIGNRHRGREIYTHGVSSEESGRWSV